MRWGNIQTSRKYRNLHNRVLQKKVTRGKIPNSYFDRKSNGFDEISDTNYTGVKNR